MPTIQTLIRARQRRATRRALSIECQVVRERDFRLLASLATDVSPAGLLAPTEERVLTGEPVIVAFRLPQSARWFDVEGTVARVVHNRRSRDLAGAARQIGVAFDDVPDDLAWYFEKSLRHVPPPVPAREARIDYAATVLFAALF